MTDSSRKRFVWRSGKVLSLRLRNGEYTLLQCLEGKWRFAAFGIFRRHDRWDDVKLSKKSLLFTNIALRQFFEDSDLTHQKHVTPAYDVLYEEDRICAGDELTKYTLWQDTPHEFEITLLGGGPTELRKIFDYEEFYTPISFSEFEDYLNIELKGVQNYPYLNERLMLCSVLKRNADPEKELMFGRTLPIEYRPYFELLANSNNFAKYGYKTAGRG